jgi:hypothetical protein
LLERGRGASDLRDGFVERDVRSRAPCSEERVHVGGTATVLGESRAEQAARLHQRGFRRENSLTLDR